MAKQVITNAKVWFGGYDLSGDLNAIALRTGVDAKDSSAIGDTTRVFTPGLKRVDAQHEGFVNAGTGLSDAALFDAIGAAATPMTIAPSNAGGVAGELAYTFLAHEASYTAGAPVGEMHRFSLAASAGGPLAEGAILFNATTSDVSVGSTAFNLGAIASGATVYAALHVLSATELSPPGTTPTLNVIIESDAAADMASPVTRVTFSEVSGVGSIGSQWRTLAGPVTDTWWRVYYAIGGGGSPQFQFVVALGIRP